MSDFVPKTAAMTESEETPLSQESTEFVPIKPGGDTSESAGVPEEGFQQKQPKPIEQSSLSPDALKGVEVPTDKTPKEGVSDAPTTDSPEESGHEFKVQIIRDGERITKMLVQCKCGETIPLDCVY